MEVYRYECETLEGFVQRVVVLAQKGYEFFVQGKVPERKDPRDVDAKLIAKYEPTHTRRERYRRKKRGASNVHYLRHGRDWVLMVTLGRHLLFEEEEVRSLRATPIRAGGYAISLRRDGSEMRAGRYKLRAHVRIDKPEYEALRDELLELAVHRSRDYLEARIWNVPFEPYRPVHRQLRALVWKVNERRDVAGFERVRLSSVRIYRNLPKHFGALVEERLEGGV